MSGPESAVHPQAASATRPAGLPVAGIVAGVGGLLAVVQAIMVWEQVRLGSVSESTFAIMGTPLPRNANGIDENGGKIVLVLGIVAVGLAVAWIMRLGARSSPALVPSLVLTAGVFIFLVAAANWVARTNDVNDLNRALDSVKGPIDISGTSYSVGLGIYVALAGGVITAAGGLLGLARKGA
jgi:hypothetical protein